MLIFEKRFMKKMLLLTILFAFIPACSDDELKLPELYTTIYSENFSRPENEPEFNFEDWTKFSQTGTKEWFKNDYQDNDYIEFSSFGSSQSSNIGWAISPEYDIEMLNKKVLIFQSAQHHATSLDNKFELLVSSNFDGTNVLSATWETLKFNLPEYNNATNYDFVNSGAVDLSSFKGKIHIAFRVTGNGLYNSNQAGGFQVDNIKLF